MCYWEFQDHGPNLDHWLVKNLRPNWTAKIPLEAFEKSTVKANDDEHKTKVDEASADGEHNVDDTLLKKPMLQTGSNEEIENCSMHSEDISNDDIESLEELSHKVDIKGHKQQNNEENGNDNEDKHEEQDGEESRKDDTEKEDVFDESLENAYGMEVVQEATTSSYCKKCEVNFKNKKSSEDI